MPRTVPGAQWVYNKYSLDALMDEYELINFLMIHLGIRKENNLVMYILLLICSSMVF